MMMYVIAGREGDIGVTAAVVVTAGLWGILRGLYNRGLSWSFGREMVNMQLCSDLQAFVASADGAGLAEYPGENADVGAKLHTRTSPSSDPETIMSSES